MGKYDVLISNKNELDSFVEACDAVFIWGNGNGFDNVARIMEELGYDVKGVLCSKGYKSSEYIQGIKVYEFPDEVFLSASDGIIMSSMEMYWNDITDCLRSNGFKGRIFYKLARRCSHRFIDESVYVPRSMKSTFFSNMASLKTIGGKKLARKPDDMLAKYEFFFDKYRYEYINVLELGVDLGGSVKMLEEYFVNANVTGVDINKECKKNETERIKIKILNVGDEKELAKLCGLKPQIIIDDASHFWSHQLKALLVLWETLNNGGIYIIEDIHTSFRAIKDWGYGDASVSTYDFLLAIQKVVVSGEVLDISRELYPIGCLEKYIYKISNDIDMISFIRESCILIKK
ncbi:hypothetical protein [Anaerovibrio sp. RM50]|uniref:hypothetical protein n=1 Tax=Anaerovibrio sp. RM50 TaxID=1200557 RepID=UPI000485C35D|nr:hypothetical protein [Anaerovibrio sp. RM50]